MKKSILTFLLLPIISVIFYSCDTTESESVGDDSLDNPFTNVEGFDPDSDIYLLILDEDAIDNGDRYWTSDETVFDDSSIKSFTDQEVNDDLSDFARRRQLRFFEDHIGNSIWLWSGQVGDEGWHALKTIPDSWSDAGPTDSGLRNYVGNPSQAYPHRVGQGLGTGDSPEVRLDEIPDVTPLRAEGLFGLIGKTICSIVYDSDVSINYDPFEGNLQGENTGTVAFEVEDVVYLPGFSDSTLPRVKINILNSNEVCEQSLNLYLDAPMPSSSSEPMDVKPDDEIDNVGYM
jgi:hypothetical protein